ncbi:MAG: PIG-L family deacetylase [Saprospiraceae bacterium]|nr:PIG-L family deacetylase [Saprospiraceae bacterium]
MRVVVFSAHPDDEAFGCGGTLFKHKSSGDEIFWIITTSVFHGQGYSEEWIESRNEEIDSVKRMLNIKEVFLLNYPTMKLTDESLIEMIPKIGEIFKQIGPEVIYILNRSDAHSDHFITFKAAMACTKSFRYPSVKKVLMYECISETEFGAALAENVFIPNYFVDISDFMDKKLQLIQIYKSEIMDHPFPRSLENVKALNHFRGATIGVKYAEAFQLLKYIDK